MSIPEKQNWLYKHYSNNEAVIAELERLNDIAVCPYDKGRSKDSKKKRKGCLYSNADIRDAKVAIACWCQLAIAEKDIKDRQKQKKQEANVIKT